MVTVVVVVTELHPPDAGIVYVTVYIPWGLREGIIAPVDALMDKPVGEAVYVPPVYAPVPLIVTGWDVPTEEQKGDPG